VYGQAENRIFFAAVISNEPAAIMKKKNLHESRNVMQSFLKMLMQISHFAASSAEVLLVEGFVRNDDNLDSQANLRRMDLCIR
jgi:hypothetical protein